LYYSRTDVRSYWKGHKTPITCECNKLNISMSIYYSCPVLYRAHGRKHGMSRYSPRVSNAGSVSRPAPQDLTRCDIGYNARCSRKTSFVLVYAMGMSASCTFFLADEWISRTFLRSDGLLPHNHKSLCNRNPYSVCFATRSPSEDCAVTPM